MIETEFISTRLKAGPRAKSSTKAKHWMCPNEELEFCEKQQQPLQSCGREIGENDVW